MPLRITYHSTRKNDLPVYGGGAMIDVLASQLDNEALTVGAGSQNGAAAAEPYLARFYPEEDCVVTVGVDAVADQNGIRLRQHVPEKMFVPKGARVAVIAPA